MVKCYTFKGQSLGNGLSCIFQALGNIFLVRFRASMTKHRQQSTRVRAEGIDPIWSQLCSSLLHNFCSCYFHEYLTALIHYLPSTSVFLSEKFLFIFRAYSVKSFQLSLASQHSFPLCLLFVCLFCCCFLIFLHLLQEYKI